MMKYVLVALVCVIFVSGAVAATAKDVSYKSGNETIQAVLYTPEGTGPFPALVVIHEWWGLNDWVKEQASRLCDEGYVTLAIDLYRGKVATTPALARELMLSVSDERSDRDLRAAFEYLKAQPEIRKDRIGAIGWSMGGGYAMDMALLEPGLAADVINYGSLTDDPDDLKKIKAPILGVFAGQDRDTSISDVHKFEAQMKSLGKKVEVHIYPDAGQAFENPSNSTGYRKDDAADAWNHIVAFLAGTLKK